MLDLFAEFKKAHLRQHLAIVGTAFAFALGVNYLLFTTDTGVKLQASAIEAASKKVAPVSADIEVIQSAPGTDRIQIQSSRTITWAKSVEFTLLANPSAVKLGEGQPASGNMDQTALYPAQVTRISNMPGVALYRIEFAAPVNVIAGTSIASIALTGSGSAGVQGSVINIATARAKTTDGEYELLAAGTTLR